MPSVAKISLANSGWLEYGSQNQISKTNLIQWYNVRYATPTTLTDLSGSNLPATLVSSVSTGSNGYMYFNGSTNVSGGYVWNSTSLYTLLNNASWNQTQEIWFRPVSSSDVLQTNAGVLVNEQGSTSFDSNWFDSQIEISNSNIYLRVWPINPINIGTINSKWTYIAWRYTNGSGLDGFLNGTKTASQSGTRTIPSSNAYYNVLGLKCGTNLGNGYYFNGYIAIYRNYARALSDTEIMNNYKAERGMFSN
jgi:hypothetical protein